MKKGTCVAFLALSLAFGVSAVRADSETSASQQLCIADQAGEQTCITTAQSDAPAVMDRTVAAEPVVAVVDDRPVGEPAIESTVAEPVISESEVAPATAEQTVVEPAIVEPAVAEPAIVEPAIAEPAMVEPAPVEPAVVEPAIAEPAATEPETQDRAQAPAAVPAEAPTALDIVPSNDEPATTGSISSAATGSALVWYPEVEVMVASPAFTAE